LTPPRDRSSEWSWKQLTLSADAAVDHQHPNIHTSASNAYGRESVCSGEQQMGVNSEGALAGTEVEGPRMRDREKSVRRREESGWMYHWSKCKSLWMM
jgi:hypothetical protein